MAYRFTSTDKWKDAWFTNLSQIEMLLFLYLCDNCDIAGFIDINYRQWAFDLRSNEAGIKGALKGLARGLVHSNCGEVLYIRNFLKHQKNYPLNEKNMAHRGIIKCFEDKGYKFDIQDINEFIEGACKGLYSPYGIGIGIGIGNNFKEEKKEKNWVTDFGLYKKMVWDEFEKIKTDTEYIQKQEKYNPNLDILLSIEKGIENYWGTEAGWKKKKQSKSKILDWKQTFAKTIDMNKVYKGKQKVNLKDL